MENGTGQSLTADMVEDPFSYIWDVFGNVTYRPSDVDSESVKLCTKVNVNDFGSKFNPAFYYVNFLLSYLGNGLVLYIIYKYEKLNTVTNIFLLNLVLSNILFATSLPFWATYHLSQWIFGNVLLVHAVAAAKSRKRSYAIISSVVVWCISIIASMKELVFQNVWKSPFNGLVCEESGYSEATMAFWRLVTYYQQFLVFFLLPLLMVIYCYVCITVRVLSTRMKEKCRAVKLIFVIIFTFFVCWTPYNVVILLKAIQSSGPDVECAESDKLDYAVFVTRNVAYIYCCISPVFYTFVGKKFQSHFKRLLVKKIPCLRRHISLSSQSTRTTSQKTPHSDYEY
ncbi:C-C chemokine receptor type 3-like isoform X2 [Hippocampus comes]|uniref:C-C chemokine receptor type 3-like isoform X2 n=1 Tax=Hippocampus comes TaxID=109280 RepID=UPI00094F32C2|nr:PREDICTED: C-C chemokine receptor type 3-like isoform X2 [Hippocampus comes]